MRYNDQEILDGLVDVLDYCHRYENYLLARCPFHQDNRPSFLVFPDKYRCLSCGVWGETSKLLAKIKPSAGSLLAPVTEINFHNPWTKWIRNSTLQKVLTLAWQYSPSKYLKDRKIDADTQKKLGIGILDNWITFPIRDVDGKVCGAVARAGEGNNSLAKYVTPHGQDANLLYAPSWKRCFSKDTIFVTFGIIDAITLYSMGYAAVSTTSGKRVHPSAFDTLRKKIVFIPDQNEEKDAMQIAAQLGWRGKVARLDYPVGTKDVNDWYQQAIQSIPVSEMNKMLLGEWA